MIQKRVSYILVICIFSLLCTAAQAADSDGDNISDDVDNCPFIPNPDQEDTDDYGFMLKWGSSGSGDGQFYNPWGIAVDSAGDVYVADRSNHRIQKFDSNGTFIAKWGSSGSADGQFMYPRGVALDSAGNTYVADTNNHRIQKFDSNGTFITKWGSQGSNNSQFENPYGIAVDLFGNIYVADRGNNRIQKFDLNGNFISKLGSQGSADGQFRYPNDVAVDSAGNIYVADGNNNRIQKFYNNGTFITKWGSYGSADSQFNSPYGVFVDPLDDVYVADSNNNRIQKFYNNGTFITKWGSYGSGDGQLYRPWGIAVDSDGDVYVADGNNRRIQKFIEDGVGKACDNCPDTFNPDQNDTDLDLIGDACDNCIDMNNTGQNDIDSDLVGDACDNCPSAYNPDQSDIEEDTIGDACDNCPDIINPDQNNIDSDLNGDACDNCPAVYNFNQADVDVDGIGDACDSDIEGDGIDNSEDNCPRVSNSDQSDSEGDGVGNACDNCPLIYNPGQEDTDDYGFSLKWGSQGYDDGQFYYPWGLTVDSSGDVYVADRTNHRIQRFDSDGTFITKWGSDGSGDGQFNYPEDISLDPSGNIYVADRGNNRIQKFNSNGAFITKWGSSGSNDSQFNSPYGVAVDLFGNVYVADRNNYRIQKFDLNGNFISKWGSSGSGDGQFRNPEGVAVDSSGDVYVADSYNHRIQKFDSNGTFITKWGSSGSSDGQFSNPHGIFVDSSGDVYVADRNNHRIQKFDYNGSFITKWGIQGSGDGQFQYPEDVAVNFFGDVYVADRNNHRIQKFSEDSIGMACDNCPDVFNPDQNDSDSDSVGDVCDNCIYIGNPDQNDSDSDLVGDVCDNCPAVNNFDQSDIDNDTIGDVCDSDMDGDGVANSLDNCLKIPNSNQSDSDNDNIGDACDTCPEIYLPDNWGDGLLFYESFDNQTLTECNHGTPNKALNFTKGIIGGAADFSSSKRVCYSLQNNFNNSHGTVEFWVKPPIDDSKGFFDIGSLGTTNSWGIFKNSGYAIMEVKNNANGYDQAWSSNSWIFDDSWHHVAAVWEYDENITNKVYYKVCLDGNCKSSYDGINSNVIFDMSREFCVGWSGWYGYSQSLIDEFRIFDYVKSDEEIYEDYLELVNETKLNRTRKECVMYKPQSEGSIQLNCSGLYVEGEKFTAKGVGYQPFPIGRTAEILEHRKEMYNDPRIYRDRDFPLLRDMNANTIRVWAEVTNETFLDAAYNNGTDPIYVIMGFWINCNENYGSSAVRQNYINNFTAYVNRYKDHPAVLAWGLGNENNLGYCSSQSYVDDFYRLCNDLAKVAYDIEGENYHPVGIINGDLGYLGLPGFSDDRTLNYTDFWGNNVYPGYGFGDWFEQYAFLSGKPLLITEYGIDALNNTNKEEYEDVQADWVLKQWIDINASNVTIGSTVMEYSDEWWKAGSVSSHGYGGYSTDRHPDGYGNEEWWGVMRTVKNDTSGSIDIMEPREVYYTLMAAFGGYRLDNLEITLTPGWNLISIPLVQRDNSIASIMKGCGYNRIWEFQADQSWRSTDSGLTEMDIYHGYWIDRLGFSDNCTIRINGQQPNATTIDVSAGWSLVGYPSLTSKLISGFIDGSLYNRIWGFQDDHSWKSTDTGLTNMAPGKGYWIDGNEGSYEVVN